jgi:hypothetical protein
VAVAAVGCVLLVLGTAVFLRYLRASGGDWDAAGRAKVLLVQLHLGAENVAAAWAASMLLLAVGVLAVGCFLVDRAAAPRSARFARVQDFSWLAAAVGFAVLSLDEMGSLHERIEMAVAMGWSPLAALEPLAVPSLAGAGALALLVLWRARRRPLALVLMVLGGAVMLSVPVVEHRALQRLEQAPSGAWMDEPGWTLAEEGLELLASLAFLAAMAAYLSRREGDPASVDVPLRTAVLATAAASGAMGVAFVTSVALVARLPRADSGIPDDWFTSAPAAVAAVGFAWLGRMGHAAPRRHARLYRLAAGYCAGASLHFGACLGYWVSELPRGGRLGALGEGAMIALALALAWELARVDARWWGRLAALGWAGLLSLGLADERSNAGWLESAAHGLLWLALLSHGTGARAQNFRVSPPAARQ